MTSTCATAAAAGLHAPDEVWIATLILAAICFVAAGVQHWREGQVRPATDGLNRALSEAIALLKHAPAQSQGLSEILRVEVAAGKRLLGEAASFEPVGNLGGLDDLLRRGEAWVDRVSDALTGHDEADMHERWTNDPRWQNGPMPITREQIDRYVVAQIRERLEVMRGFQRELRERGTSARESDSE